MTNADRIEVSIRAAVIAKSALELLDGGGIVLTRMRLHEAAKQLNELNKVLAGIEAREKKEAQT